MALWGTSSFFPCCLDNLIIAQAHTHTPAILANGFAAKIVVQQKHFEPKLGNFFDKKGGTKET